MSEAKKGATSERRAHRERHQGRDKPIRAAIHSFSGREALKRRRAVQREAEQGKGEGLDRCEAER